LVAVRAVVVATLRSASGGGGKWVLVAPEGGRGREGGSFVCSFVKMAVKVLDGRVGSCGVACGVLLLGGETRVPCR